MATNLTNRYQRLREFIGRTLQMSTWAELPVAFERAGIAWREDLRDRGKAKYTVAVLADLADQDVLATARRMVSTSPGPTAADMQDEIWWIEASGVAALSEVTRHALADGLAAHRLSGRLALSEFRERVLGANWPAAELLDGADEYDDHGRVVTRDLMSAVFGGQPRVVAVKTTRDLLTKWGFFGWPDQRIFLLLAALVDPVVLGQSEQSELVGRLNAILRVEGFHLVEAERTGGRPVYSVVRIGAPRGRAKNLIFASAGPKPTIGLLDAIDNDLITLDHEDSCLIFDDPIGEDGLTWKTLVAWWARRETLAIDEAGKSLGARLRRSLAKESPPEDLLFATYFKEFHPRLVDRLPALLPQVYLHYDPKSVRERASDRKFDVMRMDFLLLLPGRVRVVLEVDGKQHYSEGEKPSPRVYATTVRGDRELRLARYDVYRFGGIELQEEAGRQLVIRFFERLFERYGVR